MRSVRLPLFLLVLNTSTLLYAATWRECFWRLVGAGVSGQTPALDALQGKEGETAHSLMAVMIQEPSSKDIFADSMQDVGYDLIANWVRDPHPLGKVSSEMVRTQWLETNWARNVIDSGATVGVLDRGYSVPWVQSRIGQLATIPSTLQRVIPNLAIDCRRGTKRLIQAFDQPKLTELRLTLRRVRLDGVVARQVIEFLETPIPEGWEFLPGDRFIPSYGVESLILTLLSSFPRLDELQLQRPDGTLVTLTPWALGRESRARRARR